MSSAARFLLEFEATGDQEVVAKIRAVGAAGKETATELESLQGIQDPFAPIATGAESAVAPIEQVGTASTETAGTMGELVTEGEAVTTGMEEMGAATEEAGSKSESFGSSLTTITSGMAAIGGAIGSAVSAFFRYQDAQNKVVKAQAGLTRATETHRKAEVGLDAVLSKATSNTAAIAAARDRLSAAQAKVNQLMDEGVTSGQEFEAAQTELTAAQQGLSAAAQGTGVDMTKLAAAMGSAENSSAKMAVAANALEAASRKSNEAILDQVFGFGSLAGSFVQVASSAGKWGKAAGGVKMAMERLPFAATSLGLKGLITTIASVAIPALGALYAGFIAFTTIPTLIKSITAQVNGDLKKTAQEALNMFEILKSLSTIDLGPLGKIPLPFTETFAAVVPHLENYVKGLTDVKEANVDTGSSMLDLEKTTKGALDRWNELITPTGQVINLQSRFANSSRLASDAMTSTGEAAQELTDTMVVANRLQSRFGESARMSGSGFLTLGENIERVTGVVDEAKGTIPDYIDEVTGAITEGNAKFFESGQALEDNLSAQEKAVRALTGETIAAKDAYLEAKGAGDEWAASLHLQTTSNEALAAAMQDPNNQLKATALALSEVAVKYEESAQKVRDMSAILSDSTAHWQAVQTAVNEARAAVMEESIELEAAGQIASDAAIQNQKVANAYFEGAVSIAEWRNELEQSKAAQEGQIAGLAQMGLTFEELGRQSAGTIPPTIENLKLMGAAFAGTAEDSQAWRDALSEAFATVQAAGNEMVNNLSDALVKGGEDLDDITDKWLEDMPEMLRERLDESQIEAMQGMAELQALAKTNKMELEVDLKTESLAKARSDFIGNIQEMRSKAKPEFKKIYDEAIKVAEKGTAEQMTRVAAILESDDPYPLMLENLKAIKLEQEGSRMGKELMNAYTAAIKGSSSSVASAVLAASAAANVAPATEKVIKPGAAAKVDVDTTAAHAKLSALHKALTAITQITVAPKIDVDATAAHGKLTALHQALTALTQIAVAPVINVDATQATTGLNAISKAALTMRNNVNVAASGVVAATGRAGGAASSFAKAGTTAFNAVSKSALTTRNNVNAMSSGIVSACNKAGNAAANFAKKATSAFNAVGKSALTNRNNVNQLASAINKLKSKTITITTRYRTVGRPVSAQGGMHETLGTDTLIQAHAGERVDIGPTSGGGDVNINRTVTVAGGGGRGGGKEIVIPVTLMLDNKVLIRTVRRGLVEEVSGVM